MYEKLINTVRFGADNTCIKMIMDKELSNKTITYPQYQEIEELIKLYK